MSEESKRIAFISRLKEIHHILDISVYERYRKMGKECFLADYFENQNKYLTYRLNEKGEIEPIFKNKPQIKDKKNGFVAVNVEVPTEEGEKTPIIPFFSIAVNKECDKPSLRDMVLDIARNSVGKDFVTCPQFINRFHIERILFKITIRDGKIQDVHIPAILSSYDGNSQKLRDNIDILKAHLTKDLKNTFLQSWCEPFIQTDQELFCNVRAVDWDSEEVKSHSLFVCIFNTEEEVKDWVNAYGDDAMNIIAMVKSIFINDIHRRQLSEALKSAVSAIMSRNMSHNLGSHYLYYTKTYLDDLANSSGSIGPDIRGAAKVLGYMQARMDYLATVISNDRYPNGAVNFKSQLYDELTVDDFSKRHFSAYKDRYRRTTNFLLSNLVMSENFTRPSIMTKTAELDGNKIGKNFHPIQLCVKLWDGKKYVLFTGNSDRRTLIHEANVKNELSKLNIALPGGTMSAHAFFNVIENFIRNSAKYLREDFDDNGLVFTIAIRRNKTNKHLFDFVLYDNKKNASKVLPAVTKQLRELTILDSDGRIEKSSKGLKEMLFSSVWMKTYKYPLRTFVDVIQDIQTEKDPKSKLKLIEEYGFSFAAVSESGEIVAKRTPNANLGLIITLPEFSIATDFEVNEEDTTKKIIAHSLEISSDVVCVTPKAEKIIRDNSMFETYFTRPYYERDFNEEEFQTFYASSGVLTDDEPLARMVYRYKSVLDKRFQEETDGDIDSMLLQIGGGRQDKKRVPRNHHKIIYFERHLNTQKGFDTFMDYAYVDSISGGNFTITLNSLMDAGVTADTCRYITWNDKLYGLKIKESALTRITLIDERLFNSMIIDGEERKLELSLKKIRVLNVNIEKKIVSAASLEDLFEGNAFQDGSNYTHFLSIHLGLIEKIIKSDWGKRKYGANSPVEKNVNKFMEDLQRIFGNGKKVFISIHSGRGNFSKELEGPLATYPFMSLSAIENAFNNSKYLLAQLFYNAIYIGKGIINQE